MTMSIRKMKLVISKQILEITSLRAQSKRKGARCQALYWVCQRLAESRVRINTRGMDKSALRAEFERIRDQPTDDSDIKGDCVICYEGFNTTDRKPVAFNCGHVLCIQCALNIERCPKCNGEINMIIPLYI